MADNVKLLDESSRDAGREAETSAPPAAAAAPAPVASSSASPRYKEEDVLLDG